MRGTIIIALLFIILNVQAQAPTKPEDISPILIGEVVPDMQLYTSSGDSMSLKSIVNKPTVLVFYRGGWCPYCNAHLSELNTIENDIIKLGYQVVAISPDDIINLPETADKVKMKYQVYSDKGAKLIQALGLGFKLEDAYRGRIARNTKGEVAQVLPVPAALILDEKGTVVMEYIRPDIKSRIPGRLLLAVLQGLSVE